MEKLFIIRGVPGSGKTTYSNRLKANLIKFGYDPDDIVQLEADMFFEDEYGNYNWKPELLSTAHAWCFNSAKQALKNHKIVIVSNTFINIRDIDRYVNLAIDMDIDYYIYRCNNNYQNVHNVPKSAVDRMRLNLKPYNGEKMV